MNVLTEQMLLEAFERVKKNKMRPSDRLIVSERRMDRFWGFWPGFPQCEFERQEREHLQAD